ncbi:MAG TPA: hypothetical protein VKU40_18640, partial [Thermoanaerobaculia bacterium]|nr:hypothetical protein [Thermoanaerobaculia bacterium]
DRVGINEESPETMLHLYDDAGAAKLLVEDDQSGGYLAMFEMRRASGDLGFRLASGSNTIDFNNVGGEFRINIGSSPQELELQADGDLKISGSLLANNGADPFPDYVFAPGYELLPLDELAEFVARERHLPGVMSAEDVAEAGSVNVNRLQVQTLEKVEELSLYVIRQHEVIAAQGDTIRRLEERLAALEGQ